LERSSRNNIDGTVLPGYGGGRKVRERKRENDLQPVFTEQLSCVNIRQWGTIAD
jgi:hypothetical protein